MFKKANKKGFTLIELIIVVAIMAVLVALLAPNVLKYLEKTKVSKDISSLDNVRLSVEAELMDEVLSAYITAPDATSGDFAEAGVLLSELDEGTDMDKALYNRLIGEAGSGADDALDPKFFNKTVLTSKNGTGCDIKLYVNGEGGIAVVAVNSDGDAVTVTSGGKQVGASQYICVSTKFSDADLAALDCFPAASTT